MRDNTKPRILFVVGSFPVVSETFIIEQVAGLKRRGVSVRVCALKRGDTKNVCSAYEAYGIADDTRYLSIPKGFARLAQAIPTMFRLVRKNPRAGIRAVNVMRYGKDAWSLRLLYLADFFSSADFDVAHCHFGPVANIFVRVREVLGWRHPLITTFYGYDASRTLKERGPSVYTELKNACARFIVMSHDMKQRLINHGFDGERIIINPPGIDVGAIGFHERSPSVPVRMASIGRMVEKKGFDDLLRALDLVRQRSTVPFHCTLIGDGPLKDRLIGISNELGLADIVEFKGYLQMEKINDLLPNMHVYVQPSKTDTAGNME